MTPDDIAHREADRLERERARQAAMQRAAEMRQWAGSVGDSAGASWYAARERRLEEAAT